MKATKMLKRLMFSLCLLPTLALASAEVTLDHFEPKVTDFQSVQRGAKVFVNYCLNCHSASAMRYNRLQDVGLSEKQIKDNLMFASEKVGETMTINMDRKDAKAWFGASPPDLSVVARSRGAEWLYTYMRSFYRDDTSATGWNNTVFPKVGMPNVLFSLQGEQVPVYEKRKDHDGKEHEVIAGLKIEKAGSLSKAEYDAVVTDLVNYLVYMGEPGQTSRRKMGFIVVFFLLFVLVPTSYFLKRAFWKDVH